MKQYIDKDAIKAEIEKRIKETESMQPKFDQFWAGQISAFKGVLKILDSLEVKEVGGPNKDLEKEIQETQCMKSIKEKVEELYRIPRGDDTEDTVALDLEKAVAFTEGAYYVIEEIGKAIYKVINELKK